MIQIKTTVNKQMIDELTRSQFIGYLCSLIIGSLGLIAYIIFPVEPVSSFWMNMFLWVFALLFGFGLVFLLILLKERKNEEKKFGEGNEYDFNEDHVMIKEISNGEVVGETKLYYSKILRTKETEHYFFMYPNKFMAMPVSKEGLSEQDLMLLRGFFRKINKKTP